MARSAEDIVRTNDAEKKFKKESTLQPLRDMLKQANSQFALEYFQLTQSALRRIEAHDWAGMSYRWVTIGDGDGKEQRKIALFQIPSAYSCISEGDAVYYLSLDGEMYRYRRSSPSGSNPWELFTPKSAYKDELRTLRFFKGSMTDEEDPFRRARYTLELCALVYPDNEVKKTAGDNSRKARRRSRKAARSVAVPSSAALTGACLEVSADTYVPQDYRVNRVQRELAVIDKLKHGDTLTVGGDPRILGGDGTLVYISAIEGKVFIDVHSEHDRVSFNPKYLDLVTFAPCFNKKKQFTPLESVK